MLLLQFDAVVTHDSVQGRFTEGPSSPSMTLQSDGGSWLSEILFFTSFGPNVLQLRNPSSVSLALSSVFYSELPRWSFTFYLAFELALGNSSVAHMLYKAHPLELFILIWWELLVRRITNTFIVVSYSAFAVHPY